MRCSPRATELPCHCMRRRWSVVPSGTSLGGTTWLSRSMEVQCRFLLENRIDDPPRRKLLKLSILGLPLSMGATFISSLGYISRDRRCHRCSLIEWNAIPDRCAGSCRLVGCSIRTSSSGIRDMAAHASIYTLESISVLFQVSS